MYSKTIVDLLMQQEAQVFAILDMVRPGTTLEFIPDENGRKRIQITEADGSTRIVSGSSSRDVFAQACQVLP